MEGIIREDRQLEVLKGAVFVDGGDAGFAFVGGDREWGSSSGLVVLREVVSNADELCCVEAPVIVKDRGTVFLISLVCLECWSRRELEVVLIGGGL